MSDPRVRALHLLRCFLGASGCCGVGLAVFLPPPSPGLLGWLSNVNCKWDQLFLLGPLCPDELCPRKLGRAPAGNSIEGPEVQTHQDTVTFSGRWFGAELGASIMSSCVDNS